MFAGEWQPPLADFHSVPILVGVTSIRNALADGFQRFTSLSRIEIPESFGSIAFPAFRGCQALTDVIFASYSGLTKMDGFQGSRT
jgi:hypothetical protein